MLDLYVVMFRQDDPKKCTAAKLARMGMVKPVPRNFHFSQRIIVLDPFTTKVLLPSEAQWAKGLASIDCSWRLAGDVFSRRISGSHRRLPSLMAGNPTHYAVLDRLSSVEALAASLIIMGYRESGEKLLSYFKWGKTFLTLNGDALIEYSRASDAQQMQKLETAYFGVETVRDAA